MNENKQLTDEEFQERFTPGTRIVYGGDQYIILGKGTRDDSVIGMILPGARETFTRDEFEEEDFEIDDSPEFKIPTRTHYPPQVFVLTDTRGNPPEISVFPDLGALKEHNGIDGDQIMEAISDPGIAIELEPGLILVFAAIEGVS